MGRNSIFWLRGRAGSGTSTMMANLASALVINSLAYLPKDLDGDNLLAQEQDDLSLLAAFFCTNTDAKSMDCKVMTLNLISELCRVSNEFSHAFARFLEENPKFLIANSWKEIIENLPKVQPEWLHQTLIVVLDANGSYRDISDMIHKWREHLPPTIWMLLSNGTEDEDFGGLNTIYIEIPPKDVTTDIIGYAKKFLSCCGLDDEFFLEEAGKKLGDLSEGNFSVVILAEHLIKLRGKPPTMEQLDFLVPVGPEQLLYFILQEYRRILREYHLGSPDYDLLVKVLLALASPRPFAPTIAILAQEVGEEEKTKVGKVVRQLGPLVTVYRPTSGGVAPTDVSAGASVADAAHAPPARVVLFSSLLTWCVDRLDRAVGLGNVKEAVERGVLPP
ncbi:hypothetical protein HK405_003060 [Cladochytrium tenue]|nr:hypothetical protein HK405_003060 [Cladochytrium tenue]